jgi:hypothetical protein
MPSPPATEILIRGKDLNNQMVGEASAWVGEMPQYARRIEGRTVGDVTTFYKAWAPYGSAEGAAVWMVQRVVLDTNTELDVDDGLAGGKAGEFTFTWAGRAAHSYS